MCSVESSAYVCIASHKSSLKDRICVASYIDLKKELGQNLEIVVGEIIIID